MEIQGQKAYFGGVAEKIFPIESFTMDDARHVLKNELIVDLGYGSQGSGQSRNLRDLGFNVVVVQRENYIKRPA